MCIEAAGFASFLFWDTQFEATKKSFNWTFSNFARAVCSNAGKVQRLIETESFKPLSLSAPRETDSDSLVGSPGSLLELNFLRCVMTFRVSGFLTH